MAEIGAKGHVAVPIGETSTPPFVRLPDASALFLDRAARFRHLADRHELGPYLALLAGIADVQHAIQDGLPEPEVPPVAEQERSHRFGMPPLDRAGFPGHAVCQATLRRFLAGATVLDMPPGPRAALDRVAARGGPGQAAMARAVLDHAIPFEELAEHVLVAAGLQVHAARCAARLEPGLLGPVGEGACPACGSPPVSSVVVGWHGAHGARFCACSLCGTLWNAVRIRCTACGSTKGISFSELEGGPGTVKAETCAECRTYLKVLYQTKDPGLDPVADDVATSALDILVTATGLRRSGMNPFLLGY